MEASEGATADAAPEVLWLVDRLGGREGIVRGRGRCGNTISYDRPGQGGGVLRRWWRQIQKGKLEKIVKK